MPISAIYDVKGGTLAQYDQIIEALGALIPAPGSLGHIATATPDGFLVCDIWESQEALDSFAQHLIPRTEAAGIGRQSSPLMGRVENMLAAENANELPAVAILYSFPGMTAARYHEVLSHVKFEGAPPAARRAHIASETAGGMFIAGVWESEAAFRAFEPVLHAALAACGVDATTPVIGQIHKIGLMPGGVQSAHA